MEVYYLIVFFIFGLIFGSFFNVVGYRLPNNMSLISPSSHCTSCNHKLTPIELIPVVSWLIQGGKCKNCGSKIAIFYPIFELFTGIVFALKRTVIFLVRFAKTFHARSEPIRAFPIPIQVADAP